MVHLIYWQPKSGCLLAPCRYRLSHAVRDIESGRPKTINKSETKAKAEASQHLSIDSEQSPLFDHSTALQQSVGNREKIRARTGYHILYFAQSTSHTMCVLTTVCGPGGRPLFLDFRDEVTFISINQPGGCRSDLRCVPRRSQLTGTHIKKKHCSTRIVIYLFFYGRCRCMVAIGTSFGLGGVAGFPGQVL